MTTTKTSSADKLAKAIAEHVRANNAQALPVVFLYEGKSLFMKSSTDIQTVPREGVSDRVEIQLHEDRRQ